MAKEGEVEEIMAGLILRDEVDFLLQAVLVTMAIQTSNLVTKITSGRTLNHLSRPSRKIHQRKKK